MIYPINLNTKLANNRKLIGEDKSRFIVMLFLFTNFACFLALNYVNKIFLGLPVWIVIATQITLFAVIGVLLFRFIIFDETAKIKEYNNSNTDSFAKYFQLRNEFSHMNVMGRTINIFEYSNGSATCTLEFRFGTNDASKAFNTQVLLQNILKQITDSNFESRVVVAPERFKNSDEFKNLTNTVNNIKSRNLQKVIFEMTDSIMQSSLETCNTDIIYLTIRTKTNYQRADLEVLIKSIINTISNSFSAFRSIKFLNIDELLEFYREFYNIAAIDLSLAKTIEVSQELDDDFQKIISVVALKSDSDKVYRTSKADKDLIL